ncbi:endonuclease domain-containing protein [Streptomyces sp. NPDC056670]|uniref:endonuclease domain-containing protein n=1 Tax=Streptomyces sp. NPDC056670 TaxID=3345904 RepID=UPI0036C66CE1
MSAPRNKRPHESGIVCQSHKTYLLSCDEYEQLWERSGGNCEACGRKVDVARRNYAIDHDHRYGVTAVRGIVCARCNYHLARLENPRFRPTFGHGPGRWFSSYFSRAWFMRQHIGPAPEHHKHLVDHEEFEEELRVWTTYNKHLFTRDAKAALVPTDRPAEIARILRSEMSHQAFAALGRVLAEMRDLGGPLIP